MKTNLVVALVVGMAGVGSAWAEGPISYPDSDTAPAPAWVSTLTRAQVVAEYIASRTPAAELPSTVTRQQVIAEMMAARARGEDAMLGEDSGSTYLALAQQRSTELARRSTRQMVASAAR